MSARDRLRKQAQRIATGALDEMPSPCISVCRMNEAGDFCEGCMRTLEEIAAWGRMGDPDKRKVWSEIARRIDASPQEGNE